MSYISVVVMKRLNATEFAIFIYLVYSKAKKLIAQKGRKEFSG